MMVKRYVWLEVRTKQWWFGTNDGINGVIRSEPRKLISYHNFGGYSVSKMFMAALSAPEPVLERFK